MVSIGQLPDGNAVMLMDFPAADGGLETRSSAAGGLEIRSVSKPLLFKFTL